MKEETYFHIPQPCHENWDNMTPEGKGRFCGSCSKQVVDFSLMSDQQVLNYFSSAESKVCGRFANDQLQRAFTPIKEQKKKTWWIAAMMPLLFVFGKTNAQKKRNITLGTPAMIIPDKRPEIMGKIAPGIKPDTSLKANNITITENCFRTIGDTILTSVKTENVKELLFKGKIVDDENKEAISYASVNIKGTNKSVATDAEGNFVLNANENDKGNKLVISSVGYKTKEITLDDDYLNNIILDRKDDTLPSVLVATTGSIQCSRVTTGEVVMVGYTIKRKKVTKIDTTRSIMKKIFKSETFKSYPNPIIKGNTLHLELKKAGSYSIQLWDNSSKLILARDFTAMSDKAIMEITIPSSLAAGMYYIRVMDEKNKKQYTDKLIVQ